MPRFCNSRGREETVRGIHPRGELPEKPACPNQRGDGKTPKKVKKKSDSDLRTAQKRDIKPGNTENMRRSILIMES